MDFSVQATLHAGTAQPKNSLYNAIKDALKLSDLSLIWIDSNDGKIHLAGSKIREAAESPEFKAYDRRLGSARD